MTEKPLEQRPLESEPKDYLSFEDFANNYDNFWFYFGPESGPGKIYRLHNYYQRFATEHPDLAAHLGS